MKRISSAEEFPRAAGKRAMIAITFAAAVNNNNDDDDDDQKT